MIYIFKEIHYCYLMYWRTFKIYVFKVYELDPACFLTAPGLVWKTAFKKTKVKLNFLTDIDMF